MIMSESALPAATLEQWTAAVQSQQETARGFARAVADALTARVPSAAYLVFRTDADLDADLDDNLFLDSIRSADWDSVDPAKGFGIRLLRPYCAPGSDDRTTAPAEAVGDEYVTLTVVVRQSGVEGDPCDVLLGEHPDVLFVGHQDGVTLTACALGAEPGSWP
jgi:hypothetical protein